MKSKNAEGFTLVELSIVLVVIGLVVGGSLAGREMIETARVHRQISQVNAYKGAIHTFRVKYACLPGDCLAAPTLFSGVSAGNGNGVISGTFNQPWVSNTEMVTAWQMLSLAGLIEGSYDGQDKNTLSQTYFDASHPKAAIGGYIALYSGGYFSCQGDFCRTDSVYLDIAGQFAGTNTTDYWATYAVSPAQLYKLDAKIDDGKPNTGSVRARGKDRMNTNPDAVCATNATAAAAAYLVNSDDVACTFAVRAN